MVTSKCWNKYFWHLFFLTLTFYLWYFFKCLNSHIFIFVNVTEAENTGRKIGMAKSNRNCGDIHAFRTMGQQAPWPFANQRWEQFVLWWLRNYPTQIIHFIQCLDWIMNCLHKIFFFERIMRNVVYFGLYLTLGPKCVILMNCPVISFYIYGVFIVSWNARYSVL